MPLQNQITRATVDYAPLLASSETRSIDATDDWDDLEARIEATPADAKIRGMFLREVVRLAGRATVNEPRYVPFSLYPVRDYMRLLLRTARVRYPSRSAAGALLELGLGVYSLFASSIAGTAIFAVANVEFKRVCELSPKAYTVTLKPGMARTLSATDSEAVIQLRNVWIFPEIFHTGIWLGAMDATRVKGTIEVTRHSLCDVDFRMKWQRR